MKIKCTVLLGLWLLLSVGLQAQESKKLTLDEAITLSLQNSKTLKGAQAKIDEATAALKEAVEKKLPSASVSGSYLRLTQANFDLKSGNNSGGGSGSSPSVNQAVYGILNVSLPVYNGGRIRYGIESSRLLEQAIRLDAQGQKDEVIQTAIEAFANLFKAKTAVMLVRENLNQSKHREQDFANMEKNGLMARNDLLKAQLQTSNVELNLLDAENNLQLAMVNMNLMLGLPAQTQWQLDTSNITRKEDDRVLDDYLKAAQGNRTDQEAAGLRKQAALTGVKSARSERYPALSLTGGYIAADVPHVFTVTNAMDLGLGVSYNIGSLWKSKSRIEQAQARVRELSSVEAVLGDKVELEVNRGYLNLLSARKKIEVYQKAFEQASENYRIIKNKFDNNLATTTELIEADNAQLQARLGFTLARADAFVAYHRLLQLSGLLGAELKK